MRVGDVFIFQSEQDERPFQTRGTVQRVTSLATIIGFREATQVIYLVSGNGSGAFMTSRGAFESSWKPLDPGAIVPT